MRDIDELRIVLFDGERPVEVERSPDAVLMLSQVGEPPVARLLMGIPIALDSASPMQRWIPMPVRLDPGQCLSIFEGKRLEAQFVGHRGIAVDPVMLARTGEG